MDGHCGGMMEAGAIDRPRQSSPLRAAAAEMGIAGAFIRPAELARLLGVSSSAIRSRARLGTFPIPHRRIGAAILFKLEDVAAWHDMAWEEPARPAPIALSRPAVAEGSAAKPPRAPRAPGRRRQLSDADKQRSARIKAEVLAAMALEAKQ